MLPNLFKQSKNTGESLTLLFTFKIVHMKKCQDCRANNNNLFCELEYKTEILTDNLKDCFFYNYISPIEKCDKPKNKKDYIKRVRIIKQK
jgi:hypothetical protein